MGRILVVLGVALVVIGGIVMLLGRAGVPLGRNSAHQSGASKSVSPCSCADASAGILGERLRVRIAMALIVLASICGIAAVLPVHW